MTKAQKAQRDYNRAQQTLRQIAGVNRYGSNPYHTGERGDRDAYGMPHDIPTRQGEYTVRYGVDPSPAEVQAFMRSIGLNYGGKAKTKTNAAPPTGAPAPAPVQGESLQSLLERLAADQKYQQDSANAANEARYYEVQAAQDALYNRTMGEVDNWGNVQAKLNEERARESLGNIRANLASRGLTDSSIGEAFKARNDRDLALTQQDLSERKSNRRIGYDIDLTKDANAFTERRTDRAPDNSALLALAAKLGEAEAYQRGRQSMGQATRQSRSKPVQLPSYGGVSPAYAQMLAANTQNNFMGQLGGAMNYMRPANYGPAYTSNRYPTPRGSNYANNVARQAIPFVPLVGGAGIGSALGALIPGLMGGAASPKKSNPPGTAARALANSIKRRKLSEAYQPSPLAMLGKAAYPYMNGYSASKAANAASSAVGQFYDPFTQPPEVYKPIGWLQQQTKDLGRYLEYGPDTFPY